MLTCSERLTLVPLETAVGLRRGDAAEANGEEAAERAIDVTFVGRSMKREAGRLMCSEETRGDDGGSPPPLATKAESVLEGWDVSLSESTFPGTCESSRTDLTSLYL